MTTPGGIIPAMATTKKTPPAKKKAAAKKGSRRGAKTAEKDQGSASSAPLREAHDLDHIAAGLRPLAVPLGDIERDSRNARTHDQANLDAIRASLERFGQRQPLVVNKESGTILAGNARHQVAESLGWTHVAVVYVEDDAASATGYAIADNRTAELAGWDDQLLAELLTEIRDSQTDDEADLVAELQLADLLDAEVHGQQTTTSKETVPDLWQVIVSCQDETQQQALYERLKGEGYEVKLLVI